MTMLLFTRGMLTVPPDVESWREVVIAIVALSALLSPSGIFTMFIVGIPTALAYSWARHPLGDTLAAGGRRTAEANRLTDSCVQRRVVNLDDYRDAVAVVERAVLLVTT